MERLTFEGDFCDIAMCLETRGGSFCEDGACSQRRVWERLKAYEDTGLTPEEVEIMRETKSDAQFMLTELCRFCDYDRLEELAKAEEQGRLVVLPCKVGDLLYYFPAWYAKSGYEPEPVSVEEVNSFSGSIVVECYMDPDTRLSLMPADFGKTVFLTREEAEAALFNLFKRKKKPATKTITIPEEDPVFFTQGKVVTDPEDPNTQWLEMPDGLRLIFREGEYSGWYNPLLTKEG